MKTMNVMRFNDSADAPALIAAIAAVPQPRPGEMLIHIQAAGVTPTELRWYPTTHTPDGGKRTGAIPGHEFSGIVEAVGRDVDPGLVGREVFGLNDWFADGATAEYCVAQPSGIALKPHRLSHVEAAFFIVEPNQQELSEIARLLDRGELKICVDGVVPLAQASAAYFGAAGRQLGRGKVVITLIEEPRG
jgi:NADPH:quinone reductase-like Zn-dependent oxidoreductase